MRKLLFLLLFVPLAVKAQTPEAGELFQIRSVTTSEMNNIDSPVEGTFIYNSDEKVIFFFDGNSWKPNRVSSTIILNREGGNNILPTATNTYFDFPINSSHVQVNQGSTYSVTGNGEIRINEDGIYQLSASLSTSNLPAGNTKFILGVFLNGTLIGYLSRGFVTLPGRDFWGASGTLSYVLSAEDRVRFRYVLNAGGATLNAVFVNASITKL
ncbi:hypothetical protein [Algoriphagus sediminis]|uniref:Uncharacterized protein n=1 Tax=Algoriphagus sediminis TaxID=3057113 RepID=A0ABT7YH66_9BACT|nr:hypothetical protein [Algoriphagus sediminis]MDN3205826.1 hypothetical protein [Algoriphagus sediminis]